MPTTTPRLALLKPVGTDSPSELRIAIGANADTGDGAAIYNEGTLANRPGAGTLAHGTFYRSTDTGDLSYTNGTTWVSVAQVGVGSGAAIYQQGTFASRPAPGSAPTGTFYRATDNGVLANNTGTAWIPAGLATRATSGSATANAGELLNCVPSSTVTLPAAVKDTLVGVLAGSATTGSTAITVNYGSGGGAIFGPGMPIAGAATFQLGSGCAQAIMQCVDGSNWNIISGQQDTGWVALTLASGAGTTGGYYTPAARLVGNVVSLSGAIQTTGLLTANALATIPAAMRPSSTVGMAVGFSWGATSGTQIFANLAVSTGGTLSVASNAGVSTGTFLPLDGVSYRLS